MSTVQNVMNFGLSIRNNIFQNPSRNHFKMSKNHLKNITNFEIYCQFKGLKIIPSQNMLVTFTKVKFNLLDSFIVTFPPKIINKETAVWCTIVSSYELKKNIMTSFTAAVGGCFTLVWL